MAYTTLARTGLRWCFPGTVEWLNDVYNYDIQRLNDTLLNVSQLGDVNDAGIADGQVLRYSSASGKLVPWTPTSTPPDVYDWYVAKTGNDGNPGTEALPFLTIAKAISVAGAADVIFVAAGTYAENLTLTKGNFTLLGESGTKLSKSATYAIYSNNGGDDVIIDTIEITGSYRYGIYSDSNDGWIVRNCIIHGLIGSGGVTDAEHIGINFNTNDANMTVEDCLIYDIQDAGECFGVKLEGSDNCTVSGCQFWAISKTGVRIGNGGANNLVTGNWAWCCDTGFETNNSGGGNIIRYNWIWFCTSGVKAKHHGKDFPNTVWDQFWHNTGDCCAEGVLYHGSAPGEYQDHHDRFTYNLMIRGGYSNFYIDYVGTQNEIDYNMYWPIGTRPDYLLFKWGSGDTDLKLTTLTQIRDQTTFEDHGVMNTEGDPDNYGSNIAEPAQPIWQSVGAGRLNPAGTATISSAPNWSNSSRLLGWKWHESPARTLDAYKTEQSVTFQLGTAAQSWRYVILRFWSDDDTCAPKNYRIKKGSTSSGPWTTVKTGIVTNENTFHFIDVGSTQSSQFMRLELVDNYGGNYFRLDSVEIGNLS
jgi:hypothetical protein